MSRARDWTDPRTGDVYWFDAYAPATAKQIELLADIEGEEMDDLMEEGGHVTTLEGKHLSGLSQRQVLYRLNEASNLVPKEVMEHKRKRREERLEQPVCRVCAPSDWSCEGRITRHHFVPRWLMLTLEDYQDYAPRTKCTIPVCVGRHRDFHFRGEGMPPKSVVPFLSKEEREFADRLLRKLKEERPVIYDLIASGDTHSYEYQLVRDYQLGRFRTETDSRTSSASMDDTSAGTAVSEG